LRASVAFSKRSSHKKGVNLGKNGHSLVRTAPFPEENGDLGQRIVDSRLDTPEILVQEEFTVTSR
jgi:hypothetical protein